MQLQKDRRPVCVACSVARIFLHETGERSDDIRDHMISRGHMIRHIYVNRNSEVLILNVCYMHGFRENNARLDTGRPYYMIQRCKEIVEKKVLFRVNHDSFLKVKCLLIVYLEFLPQERLFSLDRAMIKVTKNNFPSVIRVLI